jgi:hypothetical protein
MESSSNMNVDRRWIGYAAAVLVCGFVLIAGCSNGGDKNNNPSPSGEDGGGGGVPPEGGDGSLPEGSDGANVTAEPTPVVSIEILCSDLGTAWYQSPLYPIPVGYEYQMGRETVDGECYEVIHKAKIGSNITSGGRVLMGKIPCCQPKKIK